MWVMCHFGVVVKIHVPGNTWQCSLGNPSNSQIMKYISWLYINYSNSVYKNISKQNSKYYCNALCVVFMYGWLVQVEVAHQLVCTVMAHVWAFVLTLRPLLDAV